MQNLGTKVWGGQKNEFEFEKFERNKIGNQGVVRQLSLNLNLKGWK